MKPPPLTPPLKPPQLKVIRPMNYDFGFNWNTKIKPHLDNPDLNAAIRSGVNGYLSCFPTRQRYKVNTAAASYSSKDGYAMLMDHRDEVLIEQLRRDNKLPKKYLDLERKVNSPFGNESSCYALMRMQQQILRPYTCWDAIKYDPETYYLSGACHWYNPTFCLTLARLVEPREQWFVQTSNKHTTVVNREKTKIFDLLYWCNDGRLERHMFGSPVQQSDETMGGLQAYTDSIPGTPHQDD